MSLSSDNDEQVGLKEARQAGRKFLQQAKPLGPGQMYLTAESAAAKVGITKQDIVLAIRTKLLDACRGRHNRYLIHPDDLEKYRVLTNQKGKA